jgi:FtsZ-binding cell division protein ZapB
VIYKKCNDCQIEKSIDLFDKRIDRNNCAMSYCKRCRKIRQNKQNSLAENKKRNALRNKRFYLKHKEEQLKKAKIWRENIKALYGVSYNTLRKRTDIQHKLRQNIRKRLWLSVIKGISTPALLGCSIEELKIHLESKFQLGMSWDNYGKNGWEIDHIKPLNQFDLSKIDSLKEASNYLNLQPLWIVENRKKGATYVI